MTTPLPRSVKVGYGVGSFCAGTFSAVPGLLLLYYLTNMLAVPAALAGFVVFLPKVWDLVVNPYVGRRSDRTVSRFGPRRPWLLAGAVTLPPAFALTFIGPPLQGVPAGLYVAVLLVLAATAYAFFEVPYKAMPSEMTDDYHEQSSLLTWRMIFLGMAILLSGALAPLIVTGGGDDQTVGGYRVMGVVIALVLGLSMVGTFFGTAKAPHITRAEAAHAVPLRDQIKAAYQNSTYFTLLLLCCTQMLAIGILLAGAPYFATYVLESPGAITLLFLSLVGPLLITMPLWVRLARRLEKRGAMMLASGLFATGSAGMACTPLIGNGFAYLCAGVIGVGYSGVQLLQLSMLADTLIADSLQSGQRRAGIFTGLWAAAETVTTALGALALGGILALAGFVASDPDSPVVQADSAITAVLLSGSLLPAALIALALFLTRRYDLTADKLAALRRTVATNPESAEKAKIE